MIRVSSKSQRNNIIDFGIIVVLPSLETLFEAKRLVIAILINGKDQNTLIEQSIYRLL